MMVHEVDGFRNGSIHPASSVVATIERVFVKINNHCTQEQDQPAPKEHLIEQIVHRTQVQYPATSSNSRPMMRRTELHLLQQEKFLLFSFFHSSIYLESARTKGCRLSPCWIRQISKFRYRYCCSYRLAEVICKAVALNLQAG